MMHSSAKPHQWVSYLAGCWLLCTMVAVNCSAADGLASVTCLAVSPDGRQLVAGDQGRLHVYRWDDLGFVKQTIVPLLKIHHAVFSSDGKRLLLAGGVPGESGSVVLLSWPELETIRIRQISDDVLYSAAFLQNSAAGEDSATVVVAGHDHSAYIVQLTSSTPPSPLISHTRPVTDVTTIVESDLILTCSMDETIRVWNATSGVLVRTLSNHLKSVRMISVRPASGAGLSMLASVSDDRTVRLFQPTIGRMVRFKRFTSPSTAVTWTTDGRQVIAGCRDGSIYSIAPETLTVKALAEPTDAWVSELANHPTDQALIAGYSDGRLLRLTVP